MKYIYGPVPSRRLGISLGISPIPKKTCNYSCVYCQLGRTDHLTNKREMFFKVEDIMGEFDEILKRDFKFDVITIVGEGEPMLYLGLGDLISEVKKRTEKPVAVITNGSLFYDFDVKSALSNADIVLPSIDAYDELSFKKINRPHGMLKFNDIFNGLKTFSENYKGQIWLEMMLIKNINDDDISLKKYYELFKQIKYDRLYLNTPIRPPAESNVEAIDHETMNHAIQILGGTSIDLLHSSGFHSEIKDHYIAIISIIKRHPMNQFEIESFLKSRDCGNISEIINQLKQDDKIDIINYKGYDTYRLK
ncbi:MAG: radical SAM protein [Anaerovoracaceae bacterium]